MGEMWEVGGVAMTEEEQRGERRGVRTMLAEF